MYVQLAEELFKDQQEYVSKVAKTEADACTLIDASFEYVCDYEGHKIFRKRIESSLLDKPPVVLP
jgi:hypothetical protein